MLVIRAHAGDLRISVLSNVWYAVVLVGLSLKLKPGHGDMIYVSAAIEKTNEPHFVSNVGNSNMNKRVRIIAAIVTIAIENDMNQRKIPVHTAKV